MSIFILPLVLIVLVFIYAAVFYNKTIGLKNYIDEAFSTMDVYLKKRWDMIPNLVEVVKGYSSFEKETLEEVMKYRNVNYSAQTNSQKIDLNSRLSMGLANLIATVENYPELKANENFKRLSSELTKIEEDIANSRKYYNGCVREYNTSIQIFPANVLAVFFNFKPGKMFEIEKSERANVKISFK